MEKDLFCSRFRELRLSKGMTQPELAKSLGLIKQRVNNWEIGVSLPSLEMAVELADYFEISLDYLVGRSDEREKR